LTVALMFAWALLAALAVAHNLSPPAWAGAGLLIIGFYFLVIGAIARRAWT
jgi:hypothetical protein